MIVISLNWSPGAITYLSSTIPIIFTGVLAFRNYMRTRYQYLLFLSISWVFFCIHQMIVGFSELFLSKAIYVVGVLFLIPSTFFLLLFTDFIDRDNINSYKIAGMTAAAAAVIITAFDPNASVIIRHPYGFLVVEFSGVFQIAGTLLLLMIAIIYLYYGIKIYRNAPSSLKFYSKIILISVFLLGIIAPLFSYIKLYHYIPGIAAIIISIGSFMFGIVLAKEPKLAFILPFKIKRLIVIEMTKGLALFTHTWSGEEELVDESLFSGMLQGVGLFLEESLKSGDIKEIYLDKAVILAQRSKEYPVICILISTRSTRTLRDALASFAEQFFAEFSPYFANPNNISQFASATSMVADRFSFIPEYA